MNARVVPSGTVADSGEIVIERSLAGDTVIDAVPVRPPNCALINDAPARLPRTTAVLPIATVALAGVTVTLTSVPPVTVTPVDALRPPNVAAIAVTPGLTPLSTALEGPLTKTFAIIGSFETQLALPVTSALL